MDEVINIIGKGMSFYTFEDFMKRRYFIKAVLESKYEKDMKYYTIYRWYIYSRLWIKDKYKFLIWDYLNGYTTEEALIVEYDEYMAKRSDMSA